MASVAKQPVTTFGKKDNAQLYAIDVT